jgi:hypothetical protein
VLKTHRAAWELRVGPIPPGLFVLHACDNPPCVRVGPGHLFLGTALDNTRDMERKGRARHPRGEQQGSAKLTWEQVDEIRSLRGKAMAKDVGPRFGVAKETISTIWNGRSWRKR